MESPRVYLAIDNCFASKRWTEPREWMGLVQSLGLKYVEASADTEADPLYMGLDYMDDWAREVARCESSTGVKVVNLYSGHGTYTTLGLGHPDGRVRERIRREWITPMLEAAARLGAGLGFYCHAFPNSLLQDPDKYANALHQLYDELAQVASNAAGIGASPVGVEQMYTPHQVPWTIAGAVDLLCSVNERAGAPFYLTIDTGHQAGQGKFRQPSRTDIEKAADASLPKRDFSPWLGPQSALELFLKASKGGTLASADIPAILREAVRCPHLFAEARDSDTYEWLEHLGRYSPIVHLQQVVDGRSAHLPFTETTNQEGSILGGAVLEALSRSCKRPDDPRMPPPCSRIYLTLEVFSGTIEKPHEIIYKLEESVRYWRRFVPEDGAALDDLVGRAT